MSAGPNTLCERMWACVEVSPREPVICQGRIPILFSSFGDAKDFAKDQGLMSGQPMKVVRVDVTIVFPPPAEAAHG